MSVHLYQTLRKIEVLFHCLYVVARIEKAKCRKLLMSNTERLCLMYHCSKSSTDIESKWSKIYIARPISSSINGNSEKEQASPGTVRLIGLEKQGPPSDIGSLFPSHRP